MISLRHVVCTRRIMHKIIGCFAEFQLVGKTAVASVNSSQQIKSTGKESPHGNHIAAKGYVSKPHFGSVRKTISSN